ncbi:MAG: hypothetical protein K6A23_03830 [Butyrivibrio sp.]|nr:hypothetical protein [Butyrivibrio sp.]
MKLATGASITKDYFSSYLEKTFNACDYGFAIDNDPAANTTAINKAIEEASDAHGTVVIPKGLYPVYTIRLKSHIVIKLEEGAVIRAARPDVAPSVLQTDIATIDIPAKKGEGGNYDAPELNKYKGLQDPGHTYFANSLIYGADLEDICITGPGVFDGSSFHEDLEKLAEKPLEYILDGDDSVEDPHRDAPGHVGSWFGNKCISMVRCKNVIFKSFTILIGGHFGILTTCVDNMLVEDILVDTNRDAFDIDACKNVTVRNSTFNSLTDDAICLKASYGGGILAPVENVLVEDCVVSGYDAGSVYTKKYAVNKLVADDRCGPTGRVKFGTEATGGCNTVIIRRVRFDRSRGFCLESVDTAQMHDILMEDCEMNHVSSAPIFIRLGDRARFPVRGINKDDSLKHEREVRLTNQNWVLPDSDDYTQYPVGRFQAAYNKGKKVCVDGMQDIAIVDEQKPCLINDANLEIIEKALKDAGSDEKIQDWQKPLFANAVGTPDFASCRDIEIRNVKITDADPRYPILIHGLNNSLIQNVNIHDISVEFRGGITMEMAIEQRQLNTNWSYSQFKAPLRVQSLPWLVNTFFCKNEALLPRVDWDKDLENWVDDPFNVPEMPDVYPESSNFGILPACGIYARHINGLKLGNITFTYKIPDDRPLIVLDDAHDITLDQIEYNNGSCTENYSMLDEYGSTANSAFQVVAVTDNYRRDTGCEYVPEYPYHTTTVDNLVNNSALSICGVTINAPSPGTPADSLYEYPTVATPESGYNFAVPTTKYPLPRTVFRPFIEAPQTTQLKADTEQSFYLSIHDPASEVADDISCNEGHNDVVSLLTSLNKSVAAQPATLNVSALLIEKENGIATSLPIRKGRLGHYIVNLPPHAKGESTLGVSIDDGVLVDEHCIEISFV